VLKKQLSEKPTIHSSSRVEHSNLGAWTDIGPHTVVEESTLGDYSYIDGDALVIYSDIGKFCSIASHVRINPGNHPMWRVTQHHMTYRSAQYGFGETDDEEFFNWRRAHRVTIGHDVWLGHGVIVMPGVSIGTGAVVGSGAVVTKDIPPYMIAAGVPAKQIRERFPDDIQKKLQDSAWWDWDRTTLEERFEELTNLELFLNKNDGGNKAVHEE